MIHLNGSSICKEDEARQLAKSRGVNEGTIGLFSAVEPCFTFHVAKNREARKLELRGGQGKCLHHYHNAFDPVAARQANVEQLQRLAA